MKENHPGSTKLDPFKIVLVYIAAGALWILLSDRILYALVNDPHILTKIQTYKGWFYVIVTAWILYGLLRRYLSSISMNITKLKKSEEALAAEKKISDMIIESLPGVFYLFDEKGKFLRWNRNLEQVSGYPAEEIMKMHPLDFFTGEDRRVEDEHIREVFQKGLATSEAELVSKDGRRTPFFFMCMMLTIGDVRCAIGTGIDITERKRLEDQLRHAQKMEAIGTLAGGVAHDFNNILSAIVGYAHLTRMKMKEEDPLKHHIDRILESTQKAAALTQSLLAFSRKQPVHFKAIDMNDLIRRFEKLLVRVVREDIELRIICADKEMMISADKGQIELVIMNLVTNARDSMPHGGHLTVETSLIQLDHAFVEMHGFGRPGAYALLAITDTGTGMDEKTKERIFEPFFTTKEVGKGTGLGLSSVYGIIKQHNGFINVYSEQGQGTTFRTYLPVLTAKVEDAETARTAGPGPAGGTETILVAEDDESVRKLLITVLEHYGYTVIPTQDGEEAVNKFIENKDKIHLFLLDIIMPKKNGKEAYEEMIKIKPDVKALFVSGYTADIIQQIGILGNEFELIYKPVSPNELARKVREVLDRK